VPCMRASTPSAAGSARRADRGRLELGRQPRSSSARRRPTAARGRLLCAHIASRWRRFSQRAARFHARCQTTLARIGNESARLARAFNALSASSRADDRPPKAPRCALRANRCAALPGTLGAYLLWKIPPGFQRVVHRTSPSVGHVRHGYLECAFLLLLCTTGCMYPRVGSGVAWRDR
jgi:hypothetical protein